MFSIFAYAQERQDSIELKSGAVIQCQILKVYEVDSIIQFCVKENGELKVKKIYTGLVDHYSWPGKDQSGKYCRMLAVTNRSDGEFYGFDPYVSIKPELTITELAAKELNKAQNIFHFGIATSTLGLMTAIAGPYLLNEPSLNNNPFTYDEILKIYNNKVKTIRLVGCGIVLAGIVIEIASIKHFQKAKLLRQESLKGLSLSSGRDGLCLLFKF